MHRTSLSNTHTVFEVSGDGGGATTFKKFVYLQCLYNFIFICLLLESFRFLSPLAFECKTGLMKASELKHAQLPHMFLVSLCLSIAFSLQCTTHTFYALKSPPIKYEFHSCQQSRPGGSTFRVTQFSCMAVNFVLCASHANGKMRQTRFLNAKKNIM